MTDQILARNKLFEGRYSCVLVRDGDIIMVSRGKGIAPLFSKLAEGEIFFKNAAMADRIIGKALALLCLFAGITSVYGCIISDCAKNILEDSGIHTEYDEIVPYIMNRDRTDRCLMEKLVDNIEDPQKAFDVISSFFEKNPLKELSDGRAHRYKNKGLENE